MIQSGAGNSINDDRRGRYGKIEYPPFAQPFWEWKHKKVESFQTKKIY